jgi:hypothetical protein
MAKRRRRSPATLSGARPSTAAVAPCQTSLEASDQFDGHRLVRLDGRVEDRL